MIVKRTVKKALLFAVIVLQGILRLYYHVPPLYRPKSCMKGAFKLKFLALHSEGIKVGLPLP